MRVEIEVWTGRKSLRWRGNRDRWWGYRCREFCLLEVVVAFFHGHRKEHSPERRVYGVRGDPFDENVEAM